MNKLSLTSAFALGLSAALLAAPLPALAQAKKEAPKVEIPANVFFWGQLPTQYLARDLLVGAKVRGAEGKIVGDIEDLIMNENNQVVGVILGVGGFLGVGEKRVGISYPALKIETAGNQTVVSLPNVTRDILKAVEPYKRAKPPRSLFDSALDKARELADKTAATSSDAYQSAREQAGPAYERAKKAAVEAYEKAKTATQQAVDKARDAAQPGQTQAPKQ